MCKLGMLVVASVLCGLTSVEGGLIDLGVDARLDSIQPTRKHHLSLLSPAQYLSLQKETKAPEASKFDVKLATGADTAPPTQPDTAPPTPATAQPDTTATTPTELQPPTQQEATQQQTTQQTQTPIQQKVEDDQKTEAPQDSGAQEATTDTASVSSDPSPATQATTASSEQVATTAASDLKAQATDSSTEQSHAQQQQLAVEQRKPQAATEHEGLMMLSLGEGAESPLHPLKIAQDLEQGQLQENKVDLSWLVEPGGLLEHEDQSQPQPQHNTRHFFAPPESEQKDMEQDIDKHSPGRPNFKSHPHSLHSNTFESLEHDLLSRMTHHRDHVHHNHFHTRDGARRDPSANTHASPPAHQQFLPWNMPLNTQSANAWSQVPLLQQPYAFNFPPIQPNQPQAFIPRPYTAAATGMGMVPQLTGHGLVWHTHAPPTPVSGGVFSRPWPVPNPNAYRPFQPHNTQMF